MGSDFNPVKYRYDLSMSKRTRKSLNCEKKDNQCVSQSFFLEDEIPTKGENGEKEIEQIFKLVDERDDSDHKSLKQLIEERNTLGQHLTNVEMKLQMLVHKQDDKGHQMVIRHHEKGLDVVRFKEMVRRCAKVLRHMIKNKRDPLLKSRRV